jgi:hypothetical protein
LEQKPEPIMIERFFTLLLCLGLAGQAAAADKADVPDDDAAEAVPEKAGPPVDPEMVRLHLMDGSVISGKLSVKNIEIDTQFGPLTIPVTELRSFTPGLGSHPDLGKKVYDLIDSLGSSDFDQRELAQKELIKLGQSVRTELQKHAGDADTERRMRIKNILEELEGHDPDDDEEPSAASDAWIQRDTIETTEFTAVGKITAKSFTVASLYGPLTVRLDDIRRGERDTTKKTEVRKTIAVDGGNLVQRGMKVTTIRVERGDRVTVTADGTMTMTPWGRAISTPEGGQNFGWFVPNSIPGGALVAAIGNEDNIFKVGSKSTFRAQRTGVLRFGIAMPPEYVQQNFPGKYNVKIRVEHP